MNDLDICLEVVSRSCQLLRYIQRWISWKPLQIEAWFQRTTNRKWHMGYQMVTWPMTSRDLERSNSKTAGFRESVPKDNQSEIVYGLSNGHMTDDVTWPQRCCEAVRSAILVTTWLLVIVFVVTFSFLSECCKRWLCPVDLAVVPLLRSALKNLLPDVFQLMYSTEAVFVVCVCEQLTFLCHLLGCWPWERGHAACTRWLRTMSTWAGNDGK